MKTTIDSKLIAILFLMNEINRLKNSIAETVVPVIADEGNMVDEVISDIKSNYNLSFNDVVNSEDALLYELALSDYISKVLDEHKKLYNEDEIRLMKKSESVNPSILNTFRFNFSDHIVDILKGVKISSVGIQEWLRNPDHADLFKSNDVDNYLCTKHVKVIGGAEYIVFYHASKYPKLQTGTIDLQSLFFIHNKEYSDMLNSPVRLFLFLLDNYGLEIESQGKLTKFLIEANSNNMTMTMAKNSRSYGQMQGRNSISSETKIMEQLIIFSYGIDIDKYLKDFKERMI